MKKLLALLLAATMVIGLTACGGGSTPTTTAKQEQPATTQAPAPAATTTAAPAAKDVEITLWTYPIGKWGDDASVKALIDSFQKAYPNIKVAVEYLDYTNGDDQVNTAIEGKKAPDLIMEGPERLVANWGAKGYMVDLASLWTDADKAEINKAVQAACFNDKGASYEFPVCMTAHCMAINMDRFKEVGADKFVNVDTHTWTTADFFSAVALLAESNESVGALYCSGQGGDQGTRALVNNLYGGTFTDAAHTKYTADSPENVKALQALKDAKGIDFNASINGGEEINLFRQGVLDMAFCWNIAQQLNDTNAPAGQTNDGKEIVFMSFPSETGESKLQGGIWGFGIFDNGDADKIEAAKTFIKYFAAGDGVKDAVKTSTYFAVRDKVNGTDIAGIWADNAVMNEYTKLMPFLGDYYQVTKGWAEARTAWWNMLQRIGSGGDVATEVAQFVKEANEAASK
ncbi:MAG: extracellular solute-binding protein [Lachnospiraceae bacterium]|nr:extracellular solute-binding protein [Lachnospiraceae bacterium]